MGVVLPYTITTGFSGTPNLVPVLTRYGYIEDAYKLFEQTEYASWLYPVAQGATSVWERWNSYTVKNGFGGNNSMNSFNHFSLGAISEWMMSDQLGIMGRDDDPGYQDFILQPVIGGTYTYAKGRFESNYGTIYSAWTADGAGHMTSYSCVVPANTTATLYLPVPASAAAGLTDVPGLAYSGQEMRNGVDSAKFTLAAGHYALALTDGALTVHESAAQVLLDKAHREVTVAGTGFRPGQAVPLFAGYNAAQTAEVSDWAGEAVADEAGDVHFTLPAEVTADLPWLGGHTYYVTLGGLAASAPVPALDVRAHSSARISLRIKGKAPLNLYVDAIPEVYTVTSSNPAVAAVSQTSTGWVVTGKKAGTALIAVRVSEEFGGGAHVVTVSVA
jgi:hypothetical protein